MVIFFILRLFSCHIILYSQVYAAFADNAFVFTGHDVSSREDIRQCMILVESMLTDGEIDAALNDGTLTKNIFNAFKLNGCEQKYSFFAGAFSCSFQRKYSFDQIMLKEFFVKNGKNVTGQEILIVSEFSPLWTILPIKTRPNVT